MNWAFFSTETGKTPNRELGSHANFKPFQAKSHPPACTPYDSAVHQHLSKKIQENLDQKCCCQSVMLILLPWLLSEQEPVLVNFIDTNPPNTSAYRNKYPRKTLLNKQSFSTSDHTQIPYWKLWEEGGCKCA